MQPAEKVILVASAILGGLALASGLLLGWMNTLLIFGAFFVGSWILTGAFFLALHLTDHREGARDATDSTS